MRPWTRGVMNGQTTKTTKRVGRPAMVALDTAPATPPLATAEGGGKVGFNVGGDGGESLDGGGK
ncbi:hypothetical protein ACJRO7_026890 [Eucalyptus globulus]|uniref:Uncharacterized protein n=1 Tax=Eucalyptus globulus TaxID=34317 RepID=A0ABD3JWP3_EUCGL